MITLEIHAKELRAIAAFASTDDTRYVLTGVLLECRDKQLRLVATNGKRLVAVRPRNSFCDAPDERVIIPRRLIDAIPQDAGLVKVVTAGVHPVEISDADLSIYLSPIEGEYPNWGPLVPDDARLKCDTSEFAARLEDLAAFAGLLAVMGGDGKARFRTAGGMLAVQAVTTGGEVLGLTMTHHLMTSPGLQWAR